MIKQGKYRLSLTIRASSLPRATVRGFGFAPRPRVMYPVKPVSALIPKPVAATTAPAVGLGTCVISVAVSVGMENMACSVGE